MIDIEEQKTKLSFANGFYLGCDKTDDRKYDCFLFKRGMGKRLTLRNPVGTFDDVKTEGVHKFFKEGKRRRITDDILLFPRPFEEIECTSKIERRGNVLTCRAYEASME